MDGTLTLDMAGRTEALPEAMDRVTRWLETQPLSPAASYLALLAVEELVTNCIKYGFDHPPEHQLRISMRVGGGELVIVFSDDGRPFNPLEAPEPDTSLPLEEREAGGLGIHFLRRLADRVEYVREGGKNHLTLRKSLGTSPKE